MYRMEKLYARHGLKTPLHHEGNTGKPDTLPLKRGNSVIDGFSDEGQELLFDDLETFLAQRMQSLSEPAVTNVKDMICGTNIQGTYLQENRQLRDELLACLHHSIRICAGDVTHASTDDLEAAVAGEQAGLRLNALMENEYMRSIDRTLPGNIHRIAAGAMHSKKLAQRCLDEGYPVRITRLKYVPDDEELDEMRAEQSAQFEAAKRLLESRNVHA